MSWYMYSAIIYIYYICIIFIFIMYTRMNVAKAVRLLKVSKDGCKPWLSGASPGGMHQPKLGPAVNLCVSAHETS